MPLTSGTRIGPYEVVDRIGAGGMGEVYRARDAKLGRDVALKVLPEAFAGDSDRLARFEREAKALASLNHPHIAQIYGFVEDQRALVMELVEGDDLTQPIARGPMPLDEAIAIAGQIAAALDAAHDHGIVHRDLKPANIKVRTDGTVKVLDFGLAKAFESPLARAADLASEPTLTSPAVTLSGVILGTAAYMSPEQARGKPVDKRADIWAFGAVLFEMITGQSPFAAASVAETIGLVVTRDPDWQALPAHTPPALRRLLAKCLTKDPRARLRDIGDAAIELTQAAAELSTQPTLPAARARVLAPWLLPLTAVVAALAAATATWWIVGNAPQRRTVARFDVHARDLRVDPHRHPVISPDGRRIAWAAGGSLWIRELDRTDARVLVANVDPLHLAWAPDSQELMFFSANRLWRVRTAGGDPVVIADAAFRRGASSPGGAWLADGRIVFAASATRSGLLVVDARGGTLQEFLPPQPEISDFHSPSPLPGSRGVLVVEDRDRDGTDTIAVVADGRLHPVFHDTGERFESPVYSADGFVLFERQVTGQGIWAIPYSLERLAPTGAPFLVAANASWPSVSVEGTLVHTRGESSILGEIALIDRAGGHVRTVGSPAIALSWPRVSPDGTRIVTTARDESGKRDLYAHDIAAGSVTRLTFGANAGSPRWAPGNRVLFETGAPGTQIRGGISMVPAAGGGQVQQLVTGAQEAEISPDGRWLLYSRVTSERGKDILGQPLDPVSLSPVGPERAILAGAATEERPSMHPSATFLAYLGQSTGRPELYLTRFPDGQGQWQVTTGGAEYAIWTPAGDALLYSQGSRVFEVPVTLRPGVAIGTPRLVLDSVNTRALTDSTFDITKDGKALVIVRRPMSVSETLGTLTVVLNWREEFRSTGK